MPLQCGAFSRDLQDKSQSPRYSPGVGGPWLQMTSALHGLVFVMELYFALEGSIQITVNDSHGYIDFIQITQYYDD